MLKLCSMLATFVNSKSQEVNLRLTLVANGITSLYGGCLYMI